MIFHPLASTHPSHCSTVCGSRPECYRDGRSLAKSRDSSYHAWGWRTKCTHPSRRRVFEPMFTHASASRYLIEESLSTHLMRQAASCGLGPTSRVSVLAGMRSLHACAQRLVCVCTRCVDPSRISCATLTSARRLGCNAHAFWVRCVLFLSSQLSRRDRHSARGGRRCGASRSQRTDTDAVSRFGRSHGTPLLRQPRAGLRSRSPAPAERTNTNQTPQAIAKGWKLWRRHGERRRE